MSRFGHGLEGRLQRLRQEGQLTVDISYRQMRRFRACCTRIDRAATLLHRLGLMGKLFALVYLPLLLVQNRWSVRGDRTLAQLVDLYAVARAELESVTGEEIAQDRIRVLLKRRGAA